MCEKLLSIIIPMYDSQEFIDKCLRSLLMPEKQMARLEVLVVDDGSKDRGREYASAYARKYPDSIFLLQKPNGGHGSAVNEGVRHCTGKYFKILDADDWVHTDALQELLPLLEAADAEVIACGYDRYDIKTKETTHIHARQTCRLDMRQLLCRWESLRQLFCLHGLIYRTDFYRGLPYRLPEQVSYDDAFFFTVPCSHADRLCIWNRQLYVYRVGDASQSVSAANREKRIGQLETVIRAVLKTKCSGMPRTSEGKEYWERKLVSVIADYYVTVFLRFQDKKQGRKIGRSFARELRFQDKKLYRRIKSRYWLLWMMGWCHREEKDFERLIHRRAGIHHFLGRH